MHPIFSRTQFKLAMLAGAVSLAAGCGGSGGDGPDQSALPSLSISGTAATSTSTGTSNAIANASVTAYCRTGYGIGMTDAAGAYKVTVTSPAQGPCVLTVSTAANVQTRSVANGDGSKANITPLTELLYQYIAGQVVVDPRNNQSPTVLAGNDIFRKIMSTPAIIDASAAATASTASSSAVPATPAVAVPTDFLTATLVPKQPGAAGNGQDAVLDLLRTRTVITAAGQPSPAVIAAIAAKAKLNPVAGG